LQILEELQRRNVVRVAIGFIVSSWLLIQVADVVLENIGAPEWVMQSILLVLALGFPVVLFFSWAYEVTPEGIKRESEIDRSQSITHVTRRKLDKAITAVLIIALAYFAVDKYVLSERPGVVVPQSVAESVIEGSAEPTSVDETIGKSIAVLPFVNMSDDKSSEYFSDGLADTVLHMLAQIRELRVAARTSSFKFRDQALDISEIGAQLNVASILEGSVQRSGDTIRITAQLIDVSNGYHLWSGNYDRELKDVFAIQDEIANEVVAALKISLLGGSDERLVNDDTDNFEAYTEFLLGISDLSSPNTRTLPTAINHLHEAVRLDPNYARAHSSLGRAYLELSDYGLMNVNEATVVARNAASRALDIAPESSEALAVLGAAELFDGSLQAAGELLEKAIENGPSDVTALEYYAMYLRRDSRPEMALQTYHKIISLDPLNEQAYTFLASLFSSLQRFDEAAATFARLREISPMSANARAFEADSDVSQGNLAVATQTMIDAHDLDPDDADLSGITGRYYLALDMPAEARRWFDRAIEVDSRNWIARAGPLFLNYYLQQNDEENFQLARQLLQAGIEDRDSSQFMALTVLVEHAAKTGRHDVALELLDNLFPTLLDDPPHDLEKDPVGMMFVGLALLQSGDVERGSYLLRKYLDYRSPRDEAYAVSRSSIAVHLALGDLDEARGMLAEFDTNRYYWSFNRTLLEHSPLFDPLREDPDFVDMLDNYREEATEQRTILQAMTNK
jgi:TolB-like protein/Flp pilus assembly protein TadD